MHAIKIIVALWFLTQNAMDLFTILAPGHRRHPPWAPVRGLKMNVGPYGLSVVNSFK